MKEPNPYDQDKMTANDMADVMDEIIIDEPLECPKDCENCTGRDEC